MTNNSVRPTAYPFVKVHALVRPARIGALAPCSVIATMVSVLVAAACINVSIPAASGDHPPTISVQTVVTGGSGVINEVTGGSDTVLVGTEFVVSVSATNPGGVKSLSVTVSQGGTTVYTASMSGTPDSSGKVPDTLSALESSGKKAMDIVMTTKAVVVSASATNFNGMTSTHAITYNPYDLRPKIISFTAVPTVPVSGETANLCYVNAGQSCTLSWMIDNCNVIDCNVVLMAYGGTSYATLREVIPHLQASQSLTVTPTVDTNTRYDLSATDSAGVDMQSVRVNIDAPPAGGQYYYYKVMQPSAVTPCFTAEIFAMSQSQADALAANSYAGDTITSITQAEYLAGC